MAKYYLCPPKVVISTQKKKEKEKEKNKTGDVY